METIETPQFMSEVGSHYLVTCGEDVLVYPLPVGENITLADCDKVAIEIRNKLIEWTADGRVDWRVFLKLDNGVYELTHDIVAAIVNDALENNDEL